MARVSVFELVKHRAYFIGSTSLGYLIGRVLHSLGPPILVGSHG